MNTELKITKGEWELINTELSDFSLTSVICGKKVIAHVNADRKTSEERIADANLIIDAGNTIQSCGLLPSQLLKQRNELLEALKESQNMLMGVDWSENEGFPECKSVFERNEKLIESTNP